MNKMILGTIVSAILIASFSLVTVSCNKTADIIETNVAKEEAIHTGLKSMPTLAQHLSAVIGAPVTNANIQGYNSTQILEFPAAPNYVIQSINNGGTFKMVSVPGLSISNGFLFSVFKVPSAWQALYQADFVVIYNENTGPAPIQPVSATFSNNQTGTVFLSFRTPATSVILPFPPNDLLGGVLHICQYKQCFGGYECLNSFTRKPFNSPCPTDECTNNASCLSSPNEFVYKECNGVSCVTVGTNSPITPQNACRIDRDCNNNGGDLIYPGKTILEIIVN